ncbi:hypothetical protein I7I51_07040 [Histoplasma capsulatum]|uniref:Cytochrome P450 alkane hydroxylase n=1 Tax=Ajellomyces capsulatus TaxID=5037 RepID=A0A8A1MQ40_AJECA|nr:hypothetical protein I7I51_07040 [Histoplasma capsulatum]
MSEIEYESRVSIPELQSAHPMLFPAVRHHDYHDVAACQSFHEEWREFLGDSIFAADGELWSRSRHLIRPMFARDRIVDRENFEKHIQKFIPHLKDNNEKPGIMRSLGKERLSMSQPCSSALLSVLPQTTSSVKVLTVWMTRKPFSQSFQYVLPRQPIRPLLPSKEFRLNLKKMDDFMQPFIDEVCDRLVAILLAGRDAAATLCFRLFELSHNPTVDAPLRTEVLDRLGTSRKPSYSDFKEMEYLTAVLNETLRLCHAAVDPTATRPSASPTTRASSTRRRTCSGGVTYITPHHRPQATQIATRSGPSPISTPSSGYRNAGRLAGNRGRGISSRSVVVRASVWDNRLPLRLLPMEPAGTAGQDPPFKFDVTLSPGEELNMVFVEAGQETG